MSVPPELLMQMAQNAKNGIGQFLGGAFGNSGAPYEKASDEYQNWMNKGIGAYNPYYNAGVGAIGNYQNALNNMQNPSDFINNLIGQYKESPYTQFMQKQGQRSINNAASASGMLGSTPYQQAGIDYSQQVAGQGLNDWLSNVLGANNTYLTGQGNLMNQGFGAAQGIGNMYGNAASNLGQAAYGQKAAEQQDRSNMWSGLGNILFG